MENVLYIHVIEPPCTEELVRQLMGPEPAGGVGERASHYSGWAVVRAAPSLRAGTLPGFALTLAGDPGLEPVPCEAVRHLFGEECRTIDEALIGAVASALSAERHAPCDTVAPDEAVAFLREHLGRKALAHVWEE